MRSIAMHHPFSMFLILQYLQSIGGVNMDKVKYTIELSADTAEKLEKIVEYRNMDLSLNPDDESFIEPSDVIKAALADYLDLFFSIEESSSLSGINMQSDYVINNRFKEIVKRIGMRQVDIINLTGISKANISQIFNNMYQPRIDAFLKIWVALDCPPLNEVLYLKKNKKAFNRLSSK